MTNQDEESLLLDQLNSARFALEQHKKAMSSLRLEQNALEKRLEEVTQAMADFFTGNGLLEFETSQFVVRYGESESVDVPDVEALPERFVRTKIIKEANKILLRELRPLANYYTIKKSPKITVTNK